MALLQFWKNSKETVLGLNIQQIVSSAGDGKLRDGSKTSLEPREFLRQIPSESLFAYLNQCLEEKFESRGFVLQTSLTNWAGGLTSRLKTVSTRGSGMPLALMAYGVSQGSVSL